MADPLEISGDCAPGYEPVRDAFAENFASRGDVGASVAMVVDGETVVDLWGGCRDAGRKARWQRDTLVNIWSTTKGVTALCIAMLVDRGLLAYEKLVADYWPEFGAHGKGGVTVAMLMSHQAGLCSFTDPARVEDFYDIEGAASRLAASAPIWAPGSRSGYHAITVGILADALCRHVDGRDLRTFVAEELAVGQGLDISIGLNAHHEARVAEMIAPEAMSTTTIMSDLNPSQLLAFTNPVLDPLLPNMSGWRGASIPSANGFATACALATLYGALAYDRIIGGREIIRAKALRSATTEQWAGVDEVLGVPARWSCGFLLNTDGIYGDSPDAFGHSGWGGAFAFADPSRRMGLAYTMNRMGRDLVGDPRNVALVAAAMAI